MPIGPTELIIILVILVLLFGARKLPELARGLGASAREFKKGLSDDKDEAKETKPAPTEQKQS